MRFFDFFAGIGGFRLGMEMAGHECVGHCEIDKYAHKSYVAMHQPKESVEPNPQAGRIYSKDGLSPTLDSMGGGNRMPKIVAERGRGEGWQQQLEEREDGLTNSLTSATKDNMVSEGIRIRKLTPKECFRLQGFPDEYFERAASVCSDSQLYKQAGNSVTVNVIYEIAKRLKEIEK